MDGIFINMPEQIWPPEFLDYVRRREEKTHNKWVNSNRQQQVASASRRVIYWLPGVQNLGGVPAIDNNVLNPINHSIPGLPDSIPSVI